MKKEEFVALGISEELAAKAEQESKMELEGPERHKGPTGKRHQDQGQTTGGTEEGQRQQ